MKKLLLSLCLMATLGSFLLNAEEKMSPSTQNFLRSYESTSTISQRAKLKSTYAINPNNGEMAVSAFLHLVDENNLDGLEENQVIINAQYGTILSTSIPADNLTSVSQLPSVKYIEIGRPVHQRMNNVRSEQFSNVNKIHEGTGLTQAYAGKDVIVGTSTVDSNITISISTIQKVKICVSKEYGTKTSRERHPPAIIMEQNIRMPRKSSRQNRIMQLAMLPTSRELQPEHIKETNTTESLLMQIWFSSAITYPTIVVAIQASQTVLNISTTMPNPSVNPVSLI